MAVDRACSGGPTTAAATTHAATTHAATTIPAVSPAAPSPIAQAPIAYAPGACQAQAPTGRSRNQTVFVDPGTAVPIPASRVRRVA